MDNFLAGRRVLLVEDEMMILLMVEDILADFGCESITTAATVEKALALIATQVFDVALLDVNLDGTKSFAIADVLAAQGVPFVFATGYGQSVLDAYRDRPVLTKPFRIASIKAALMSLGLTDTEAA